MIDRIINSRGRGAIPALVGFLVLGVCATPVLGPVGQALAKGPQHNQQGYQPGRKQGHTSPSHSVKVHAAPGRPAPGRPAKVHVAPSRPAPGHPAKVHVAPSRPAQVRIAPSRPAHGRPAQVRIAPGHVAQGRHSRARPAPGIVSLLPRGHGKAHYRGRPYYYHRGRYYRPHRRGYVLVPPPWRMLVPRLPLGCATLLIAGITYYTYLGVYYQRVPTGYIIVAPPVGVAPAPPLVNSAYSSVTVAAAALNVRQGPGANYAVLYVVNLGETLNVLAVAPGWLYVQTATGQLGWVDQSFTSPLAPGASG